MRIHVANYYERCSERQPADDVKYQEGWNPSKRPGAGVPSYSGGYGCSEISQSSFFSMKVFIAQS
jgi:hypothetical protein